MKWPTVRLLRTAYPDLAGMLRRNWTREGFLVGYRYHRRTGFDLVAARPRWRWVLALIFRLWPAVPPRPRYRYGAWR